MANRSTGQYFAALAAASGAMALGTVLEWSNPAEASLGGNEYGFRVSGRDTLWFLLAMTLGAAGGCILTGFLINVIGRKTTMISLVLPFTIGWIMISFGRNVTMLQIGRAALGVSSGGVSVIVPIYLGEIAEKEIRGILVGFFQLFIAIGILFIYVVSEFVNLFWLNLICGTIPLIFGVFLFFCPESPTYLIQKNKLVTATEVPVWLRGKQYNPSKELDEIRKTSQAQPIMSTKCRKSSWEALSIIFGLFICHHMCGIHVFFLYSIRIFEKAKIHTNPTLSMALLGILHVLVTFFSAIIIDRVGRRISQFVVRSVHF